MKKLMIAITAFIFASAPALALGEDWWLVSGEPGDTSVQFIDASSVEKQGNSMSFDVATYWSNGRSMERDLTMNCNVRPGAESYAELWTFACGTEELRMKSALKLGSQTPEWLANTIFTMPT